MARVVAAPVVSIATSVMVPSASTYHFIHVSTMSNGDFFHNETSVTLSAPTVARIEHAATDGTVTVLRVSLPLLAGEVIDGTYMSKRALVRFLGEQVADARERGVLFSLHMKATMMKVSDPIIFGHAVRVFFKDVFAAHAQAFDELGAAITVIPPSAIPVPATVWLFGTALIGLVGFGKRRKAA